MLLFSDTSHFPLLTFKGTEADRRQETGGEGTKDIRGWGILGGDA
ncbi:MAG: hypothetical protein AB1765_04120 [Candidatus Hydrogenedentota bacterium]